MSFKEKVLNYLSHTYLGRTGSYASRPGGPGTLYASCYAVMILHYLGELENISNQTKEEWLKFICSYQNPKNGYFEGPEIINGNLLSAAHSKEHLLEHLTVHVLPAVKLLGGQINYPLEFAYKYTDSKFLRKWLSERDLNKAWIEGNNLLFVGEMLTYLYEEEGCCQSSRCINIIFDWLDDNVNSTTGLWGSSIYVDKYKAVYGGYHQLLLYYYHDRPIKYMSKIVDTVLSIQHLDGGFSAHWGGGGCQDVDSVDILVNMYKLNDYRRSDILYALKKCYFHMKRRFKSVGGFAYRNDSAFIHMGMEYTSAGKNCPDMFSTWFGVHTMCLIAEIVDIPILRGIDYEFNDSLSMGWHRKSLLEKEKLWEKNQCYILAKSVVTAQTLSEIRTVKNNIKFIDIAYRLFREKG